MTAKLSRYRLYSLYNKGTIPDPEAACALDKTAALAESLAHMLSVLRVCIPRVRWYDRDCPHSHWKFWMMIVERVTANIIEALVYGSQSRAMAAYMYDFVIVLTERNQTTNTRNRRTYVILAASAYLPTSTGVWGSTFQKKKRPGY